MSNMVEQLEVLDNDSKSDVIGVTQHIELMKSIALLDAVIESTADAIVVYSLDGYVVKMNQQYCRMLDIDKYDAYLLSMDEHIDFFKLNCLNTDLFIKRFKKSLNSTNTDSKLILKFTNNRFYKLTNSPYVINGKLLGRVLAFHDITGQKNTELALIEREALYRDLSIRDNLTGIFNRRKILLSLKDCYDTNKKDTPPTSLIMFDLNDFKCINDTYGHNMGDYVLKQLSESISGCIRKKDIFGRWGGDEFVILLHDSDKDKAYKTVRKIQSRLDRLALPIKVPITCSFGISVSTEEKSPEDLINRADSEMYLNKSSIDPKCNLKK